MQYAQFSSAEIAEALEFRASSLTCIHLKLLKAFNEYTSTDPATSTNSLFAARWQSFYKKTK